MASTAASFARAPGRLGVASATPRRRLLNHGKFIVIFA
jgi:hypothetical protein